MNNIRFLPENRNDVLFANEFQFTNILFIFLPISYRNIAWIGTEEIISERHAEKSQPHGRIGVTGLHFSLLYLQTYICFKNFMNRSFGCVMYICVDIKIEDCIVVEYNE